MAKQESTQGKGEQAEANLENFNWDDSGDFFGIEGTAVENDEIEQVLEVVKIETEEEEEAEVVTKINSAEEEEDGDEGNFFGIKKEEDEEEGIQTPVKKEKTENRYQDLYEEMKGEGFFTADLEEGTVVDKEKFIELQDLEIEARVDEALEGFLKELDEDGAAFLKFKKEGGSTADFFKTYGNSTGRPTGDLDDEVYQEKVSRYYYEKVEGLDPEDVDDRIEWLKDGGKLSKYAAKIDADLIKSEKKQKEDLQAQAKADAILAEAKRKEFIDSVQETLDNTDEIDNFTFTPTEKKSLHSFITKPSIKIGKNQYVTPFQQKLRTALGDKQKMIILAKLLSDDFDVSGVVAARTTMQTKKIQNDLQRKKSGVPKSSGDTKNRGRSLAEFFN